MKVITTQTEVFQTSDGRTFEFESDATAHEERMAQREFLSELSNATEFRVNERHVKAIKAMCFDWMLGNEGMSIPYPKLNQNRPFGTSDSDLGLDEMVESDDREIQDYFLLELSISFQILIENCELTAGRYVRKDGYSNWEKVK